MAPGSVIVDLAGDSGGNCELTEAGKTVVSDNGVKVISPVNLPSDMAANASQLYAKNIENLLGLLVDEEGKLELELRRRGGRRRLHHPRGRDPQRAGRRGRGRTALMDLDRPRSTIFVLAAFVGFEVISKVPTTLHTPLMSQTNAIHGIVMLGGLIVVGFADDVLEKLIGVIAIAFGTINIVGGFMVTDRMLGMFVRKPKPKPEPDDEVDFAARRVGSDRGEPLAVLEPGGDAATALYIVSFSMFIFGVRRAPIRRPPSRAT